MWEGMILTSFLIKPGKNKFHYVQHNKKSKNYKNVGMRDTNQLFKKNLGKT